MKVLIVEDEMIIAIDLESLIEQSGNDCVGVSINLVQAKKLMTNDVKIIFMDINLNGKDNGFEVAEILRKDFDFYLVFISASNNKEKVKRAESFNNCTFIKKPFTHNTIEQVIENAKTLY